MRVKPLLKRFRFFDRNLFYFDPPIELYYVDSVYSDGQQSVPFQKAVAGLQKFEFQTHDSDDDNRYNCF